ncbi:MAG: uncharacterized protein A8A55_1852 [Amphiamblys sp. WSBS2006]|nr:MAG: uncharacterized protein A8A55_1852 [Amphiamblys sp. WSBS2006]
MDQFIDVSKQTGEGKRKRYLAVLLLLLLVGCAVVLFNRRRKIETGYIPIATLHRDTGKEPVKEPVKESGKEPRKEPEHPTINASINTEDDTIEKVFSWLADEYLAPWLPMDKTHVGQAPITKRMLCAMELAYRSGAFRVRIIGKKVYYRHLVVWKQTYRKARMVWYLKLLKKMALRGMIKKPVDVIIYVGDGPKVAGDTATSHAGFPLFSLRTADHTVDIPLPDPVVYGSNGNYVWPEKALNRPWTEKKKMLVFRGKGSCLKMQADNWHVCNRIRAVKLADMYPELMDIKITELNQLDKISAPLYPPPTKKEVLDTTRTQLGSFMSFFEQAGYRYVLDLDGGLGSSRKPATLRSGSVLFAQKSPWFNHFEPLLQPYVHYVPVDKWLRDLREKVEDANTNESKYEQIAKQGREFAEKFLTIEASMKYISILFLKYADLLVEEVTTDPVEINYCEAKGIEDIMNGPIGCSRKWTEWIDPPKK